MGFLQGWKNGIFHGVGKMEFFTGLEKWDCSLSWINGIVSGVGKMGFLMELKKWDLHFFPAFLKFEIPS